MVKQKYRKERQRIIASFSYTDVAEGTGVIRFLGASSKDQTTNDYFLSSATLASNDINTQASSSSDSEILDLDFDVIFNRPQNMKGIVKVQIPLGGRTTSGAPNSWTVYAIVKLRKFDGSTESDIASSQSEVVSGGGGSVNVKESKMVNLAIDASSAVTHFKKGDILRITVSINNNTVSGGTNTGFGHDPKDRTDVAATAGGIIADVDSTQFVVNIPFVLNI